MDVSVLCELPSWVTSDAGRAALPDPALTAPLTRYEETVAVSWRAIRLAQGAPPNVAVPDEDFDVLTVARTELECGTTPPMRVIRYRPDETHAEVDVNAAVRPPHVPCYVLP